MTDFIKDTWEKQAEKFKDSHWVSWGDNWAIELETDNIAAWLKDGDRVLDVGCANGFASMEQFKRHKIDITGVDFSEGMIKYANEKLAELGITAGMKFQTGDVRKLDFPDETFDAAYTTRVLINLPNWEEQKQGILECLRVTKKGGTVILSEAFWEPLVLLNSMRKLVNLHPLIEHDFNRYIKETKLNDFLTSLNLKFEVIDFSSIYYLGSRFLRELVTEIDKYPGFSNPINEIFCKIEKDYSGGGFGIQKAVVITK
jgi:ubiquinone/menaquinone biosynthesis C-methylase UbiE